MVFTFAALRQGRRFDFISIYSDLDISQIQEALVGNVKFPMLFVAVYTCHNRYARFALHQSSSP